jgi:hypothetical protein
MVIEISFFNFIHFTSMLKTACLLLLIEDNKMHVPGLDCAVVSSSAGTEAEPYILKLENVMNLSICTEYKHETYSLSKLQPKYNTR